MIMRFMVSMGILLLPVIMRLFVPLLLCIPVIKTDPIETAKMNVEQSWGMSRLIGALEGEVLMENVGLHIMIVW